MWHDHGQRRQNPSSYSIHTHTACSATSFFLAEEHVCLMIKRDIDHMSAKDIDNNFCWLHDYCPTQHPSHFFFFKSLMMIPHMLFWWNDKFSEQTSYFYLPWNSFHWSALYNLFQLTMKIVFLCIIHWHKLYKNEMIHGWIERERLFYSSWDFNWCCANNEINPWIVMHQFSSFWYEKRG